MDAAIRAVESPLHTDAVCAWCDRSLCSHRVDELRGASKLATTYSHRADGPAMGMIESIQSNQPPQLAELQSWLTKNLTVDTTGLRLVPTSEPARWIVQNTDRSLQYALVRQSEEASRWTLHQWDHWYDYPGSYWTKPRPGVDAGEPSRLKYAFQLTIGHHGIFSLTPIWCLVPFGLLCWLNREQSSAIRLLAASIRWSRWFASPSIFRVRSSIATTAA